MVSPNWINMWAAPNCVRARLELELGSRIFKKLGLKLAGGLEKKKKKD